MAASQRGILRPRKTEADAELRAAILAALLRLQGDGNLSQVATDLGVSVKTLSRYRNSNAGRTSTLGGDILFRIFELCDQRNVSIACRGRLLRLPREGPEDQPVGAAQLRFAFEGTFQIDVPARKGMMTVRRVAEDQEVTG